MADGLYTRLHSNWIGSAIVRRTSEMSTHFIVCQSFPWFVTVLVLWLIINRLPDVHVQGLLYLWMFQLTNEHLEALLLKNGRPDRKVMPLSSLLCNGYLACFPTPPCSLWVFPVENFDSFITYFLDHLFDLALSSRYSAPYCSVSL